ncbi:MAG: hypothetical protein ACE5OZ_26000 [Candidatus Heimdallarchaeota archaeon]
MSILHIFDRLYSAGIFDWADHFLMDQEMALLQLLREPPDQVRRELLAIQQQQGKEVTEKARLQGLGKNQPASSEQRHK